MALLMGRRRRRERIFPVPTIPDGETPAWLVPGPGPDFKPYDDASYRSAMTALLVAADRFVNGWNEHHQLVLKEPTLQSNPGWREAALGLTRVFEDLATHCRSMEALTIPSRWRDFHAKFVDAFAVLNTAGWSIRRGIEQSDPVAYQLGLKSLELYNNALNYEAQPLIPR